MALVIKTRKPKALLARILESIRRGYNTEWRVLEGDLLQLRDMQVLGVFRATVRPREALVFGVVPSVIREMDVVSFGLLHARMVEALIIEHDRYFESVEASAGFTDDDHREERIDDR